MQEFILSTPFEPKGIQKQQFQTLIEGYSIKTKEQDIFDVRGVTHPKDEIIAYIKYAYDTSSKRYTKMRSIREGSDYLRKYGTTYLRGSSVQCVAYKKIDRIYDPKAKIKALRESLKIDELQKKVVRIVHYLEEYGLDVDRIGVSGSILCDLHSVQNSDIDLSIYGKENGEKFFKIAPQLFKRNIFEKYDELGLLNLYRRHNYATKMDYNLFVKINREKVNQGYFEGSEFFIKCIDEDLELFYPTPERKREPFDELKVRITPNTSSIFTPGTYDVSNEYRKAHFFRARFSGIAKPMDVIIKGHFEKYKNSNRIIIGEILRECIPTSR